MSNNKVEQIDNLLSQHWQSLFSPEVFFQQLDIYQPTPLTELKDLASAIHVGSLQVKDERNRLGLGSFKSVGGVYAVACILQALIQQREDKAINPEDLFSEQAKALAAGITFCCATAGNHGVAVAKAAQLFGAKSVVYLSTQVDAKFEQKLMDCGAEIRRKGDDYQQSISAAEQASQNEQLILVSHNSWRGNRKIPQLIMRGYQLIASEMQHDIEQQAADNTDQTQWPDYVFLHGGARGLAMGIAKTIRCSWPVQPQIIVVEQETTAQQASTAAELTSKQSALLAYEYLSEQANHFYSVSEKEAENAVAILRDYQLDISPSEAVGFAGIKSVLDHKGDMNWSVGEADRCLFVVSEMD